MASVHTAAETSVDDVGVVNAYSVVSAFQILGGLNSQFTPVGGVMQERVATLQRVSRLRQGDGRQTVDDLWGLALC